jgi:hypothetical protein
MSERNVMALLAAANPVCVDAVQHLDLSVDSILAIRRRPPRRLGVVAAGVALALAAAFVGVFVFGGHREAARTDRGTSSGGGAADIAR